MLVFLKAWGCTLPFPAQSHMFFLSDASLNLYVTHQLFSGHINFISAVLSFTLKEKASSSSQIFGSGSGVKQKFPRVSYYSKIMPWGP